MQDIEFIFDFASPNAYLSHKVLPTIAAKAGAKVVYTPCLLGGIFKLTNNQAPMISYSNINNKLNYERLEFARFVKRHALSEFVFNPHFPVTTVLLMRGAVAAQEEGKLDSYIAAGLRAMWEEGENMSDPDVFVAAMDRHGLDGAHFVARAQEPKIKRKLMENTDHAVARGAFGVPTFFVGDEIFFGKERLGQVEAAVRELV